MRLNVPVSLTLAALVLAGCGAVPTAKGLTPKSNRSVTTKSTGAKASPSPKASVTPAPVDDETPPPALPVDASQTVVVAGMVYGADGALLTGAVVTARSLDAAAPYAAEVKSEGGAYVLNGVPSGAAIEIVATRPGFTARRRVGAFAANVATDSFDFGAPTGRDNSAAPFYLSDLPEVVSTTPADNGRDVAGDAVSIRVELSEPLDAANRARFARAFRLLPANDAANGGAAGTTTDLKAGEDLGYPRAVTVDGNAAVAPYDLRVGSTFMADPTQPATMEWDATGKVATFAFKAPLLASNGEGAAYQMALVSGGADERIRDMDGNQLGTDAAGGRTAYPAAGDLVLGAFKARKLRFADIPGLEAAGIGARWAATHDDAVRYELARDEQAPSLMGVRTVYLGSDTKLELTFDEPMGAYNNTLGAFVSPALGDDAADLANYTFALGRTPADLADKEMDGEPEDATEVDPRVVASYGAEAEQEREFRFAAAAFAPTRVGAATGAVIVELDDRDPRKVWVTIAGRPRFFAAASSAVKARVANVADPAGNDISERRADRALPIGAL